MPSITANNITIEYDTFGDEQNKPLLLVMGLGAQMIAWDPDFCQRLADAGHYVIRYDNRDVGLSTYFSDHGEPDMEKLMMDRMSGKTPDVAYTLDDMAADGMALLSELDITQAHICGASLGGMIVQAMAINHPDRVLSMTSIMSTTGNPDLPPAEPEAMAALGSPRKDDPEHAMQRSVEVSKIIGSPGFPRDEARLREKGLENYERAYHPEGVGRQMAAVITHGDRRPGLNKLGFPCLVIHGNEDPLVPVTGGVDTHENIPDAQLMIIDGMGHDLPMGAWNQMVTGISDITSVETSLA
jgi:pimeloyl-ACP methyl ester carboxylesterase